jgi:hypothetical protein
MVVCSNCKLYFVRLESHLRHLVSQHKAVLLSQHKAVLLLSEQQMSMNYYVQVYDTDGRSSSAGGFWGDSDRYLIVCENNDRNKEQQNRDVVLYR